MFQRCVGPFEKVHEVINNLITRLSDEAASVAEHKGWCDTELATNEQTRDPLASIVEKLRATVHELEASMENLAREVAELSAQLSRLREEVPNATSIRHEEAATNEEAWNQIPDEFSTRNAVLDLNHHESAAVS